MILNLGVDFGTSSTKMFCRDLSARRDQQLSVVRSGRDGEKLSIPSTMRIKAGKVWFGHEAEAMEGGQVFRSLKVCVACCQGAIACRCTGEGCGPTTGGDMVVDGAEGRELVSILELCTILVAGLLNGAVTTLVGGANQNEPDAVMLNVAAPLDQVAHDPLGDVFEQVLGHATSLRAAIFNGMSWKAARLAYRNVVRQPLPSSENRTFWFFPEAIAAIHAYTESPTADEGLYALIDVGAGTTAVSFFRLGHESLDRRVAFYASHTEIVGADDMDIALSNAFRSKYPAAASDAFESRSRVRSAKELMCDDGGIAVGDYLLTPHEVGRALGPVFDRIFEVYVRGFRAAYAKERGSSRWEKLTLVLVGGGSLVPGLVERLLQAPIPFVEHRRRQPLSLPKGIRAGTDTLPVTLLAVGFGLSFVATDVPEYWRPNDIDPLIPRIPWGRPKDQWGENQV